MALSYNEDMSLITWKIEIQKQIIDKLTSDMNKMEVDFKVQIDLMAIELTSTREKCERFKRRIEELEGNLSRLKGRLLEENEHVNVQDDKASKKINNLESQLARDCEHRQATSFGRENESHEITSDTANVEIMNTNSWGKLIDSSVDTSGELDEESVIADIVNSIVEKAVEADKIKQAKHNKKYEDRKHDKENRLDVKLTLNPICALQELCHSRCWPLPKYEFFQEGNTRTIFTTECTALTFTVRVEGMKKKEGKIQAATLMYNKLKNVAGNGVLSGNYSGNNVPENKPEGNELDVADVVEVSALSACNDDRPGAADEISVLDTCKDVVAVGSSANESMVAVNGDDRSSWFGNVDRSVPGGVADVAKILGLSNNPSARALKEMKVISPTTVPSNTELLRRITEEEGLTLAYDVYNNSPLPIEKHFNAVQITIVPGALTVVGYGDTVHDGREDAALECLTRFKSMLVEQDVYMKKPIE